MTNELKIDKLAFLIDQTCNILQKTLNDYELSIGEKKWLINELDLIRKESKSLQIF